MIIVDDVTVDQKFQNIAEEFFSTVNHFCYVENGSGKGSEYNPMATNVFCEEDRIFDRVLFAFTIPFLSFCLKPHKLNSHKIMRARLFYQPASVREDGYLHDCELHRDAHFRSDILNFLYYCNVSDGGTYIYNENKEDRTLSKFVEHKKGRFVIFDDKLWHAGSKPTKNSRLVLSVNFKLEE